MTNDPNDLLKQIRARANSAADDAQNTDTAPSKQSGLAAIRAKIAVAQANRPKRDLTKEEQKRLAVLQDIHVRLEQGQHVQNRRLKTWLTAEEYADFEQLWEQQKDLRKDLRDKPEPVKEYEERLKLATLFYNRADYYSRRGKSDLARDFRYKCEAELERLLEYYAEILHADPSLTVWFDRELNWTQGGDAVPDIGHVPRTVTSNSIEANSTGGLLSMKQNKRDVKLAVVARAMDALLYE